MPYSPEIYQSATLLLESRRDDAERLAERRRTEIYAAIPASFQKSLRIFPFRCSAAVWIPLR